MKRASVSIAVVLLVLLAGCAAMEGGDGDRPADLGAQPNAEASGGDRGDGGQSAQAGTVGGQPLQVDRAIVRTGEIEVRVEDFSTARSEVVGHARSLDGYVGGSDATLHTEDNTSWTTGHVVVRVPSEQFSDMLEFARDRGTVVHEETQTEDVSDELVDLEARLTNSKKRRARLRSFYEEAETTNALLSVEERLSAVQEEIERLQAKQRSLEDRVAYSTLRVRLVEPDASGTGESETGGSALVTSFLESTWTAVDYAYGAVLFIVRLVPYLVLFGLPAVVVGHLVRRRYGSWRASPAGVVFGSSHTRRAPPSEPRTETTAESGDETTDEE